MSLGPQQGTNRTILASKETLYLFAFAPWMGCVCRVNAASIQPALETQSLWELGPAARQLPAPKLCPDHNGPAHYTVTCATGDDFTIAPKGRWREALEWQAWGQATWPPIPASPV